MRTNQWEPSKKCTNSNTIFLSFFGCKHIFLNGTTYISAMLLRKGKMVGLYTRSTHALFLQVRDKPGTDCGGPCPGVGWATSVAFWGMMWGIRLQAILRWHRWCVYGTVQYSIPDQSTSMSRHYAVCRTWKVINVWSVCLFRRCKLLTAQCCVYID